MTKAGILNVPVWFEAGATNFTFATPMSLFIAQVSTELLAHIRVNYVVVDVEYFISGGKFSRICLAGLNCLCNKLNSSLNHSRPCGCGRS